jgi:hypothetical protein
MFIVPAREAPLDAYGNVPSGFIVRMLSDLRAFGQSGYRANRKEGRRTGRRASNALFVVPAPGKPGLNGHLQPSIWRRMPNRMLAMVFVFTASPAYRKRSDFWGISQTTANREYPIRYAWASQYVAKR